MVVGWRGDRDSKRNKAPVGMVLDSTGKRGQGKETGSN
jgi:hypothetical protein